MNLKEKEQQIRNKVHGYIFHLGNYSIKSAPDAYTNVSAKDDSKWKKAETKRCELSDRLEYV
jgi:hypothetical protein